MASGRTVEEAQRWGGGGRARNGLAPSDSDCHVSAHDLSRRFVHRASCWRARCGNSARRDLRGGRPVTGGPTSTANMTDAPIVLVDYDPRWPQLFHDEQVVLARTLAPWIAGPIEHIGSTAIPGLIAKPVIDIMVPVHSLAESRPAIEVLKALDYFYAPYKADFEHWFCKPHPSFRTHHLHLVPYACKAWFETLQFRDTLRINRAAAEEYGSLKRSLSAAFITNRDAYTEGKTVFVDRILNHQTTAPNLKSVNPTPGSVTPRAKE